MTTTVEIIWDKHYKLIIRDVHEKWHDRVKTFMLEKYFKPHRLFNQLNFQDDPGINEQYLKYLTHILRDECSMVVLHEETNEIFAVAILKCMTREWRSWIALQLCIDTSKIVDIIQLQYRMINEYAIEYPEDFYDSLHIFDYYIDSELKYDDDFMMKFFNGIYETAKHMKMPRVTFLALSQTEQEESNEQGYERLCRAIYSIYAYKNRLPFAALRDIDEMEAGLYAIDVEPLIPYYSMKVRGVDEPEPPKQDQKKLSVMPIAAQRRSGMGDDD